MFRTNGCNEIFVICMHMICNQALSGCRRFERMDEHKRIAYSVRGAKGKGERSDDGRECAMNAAPDLWPANADKRPTDGQSSFGARWLHQLSSVLVVSNNSEIIYIYTYCIVYFMLSLLSLFAPSFSPCLC